jgi:uncharacterized protein YcfJ
MKQPLLFAALGLVGLGAAAQEVGNVISAVPVIQQVAVPRQVCGQPVVVEQQTSGGGGLLGAIAGGAIGSQVGGGSGRAAGVLIGTVAGAIVGNNIEAGGNRAHAVPQCTTQTTYENRTVGYNVTYEYAGRQYTVQMPHDPGPTIRLQVTPVGASDPAHSQQLQAGVAGGPVVIAPPVHANTIVAPAPVMMSSHIVTPAYYYPPPVYRSYAPIGISLGFGYSRGWGGHHHHRHRHHRH